MLSEPIFTWSYIQLCKLHSAEQQVRFHNKNNSRFKCEDKVSFGRSSV